MPKLGQGKALLGVLQGISQARDKDEAREFKKEILKLEQDKLKIEEREQDLKYRATPQRPTALGSQGVYIPGEGFQKAPWDVPGGGLRGAFATVPQGSSLLDLRTIGGTASGQPGIAQPPTAGGQVEPVYINPRAPTVARPPARIAVANELMERSGGKLSFEEALRIADRRDKKSFVQDAMKSLSAVIGQDPEKAKMLGGARDLQTIFEDIYDRNMTGTTGADDFFNSFGSEIDEALATFEDEEQ